MKKMVISFDEAVETLKEHYGVSDVEIVDLPAKRNATPPKMKGGVRLSNEYWEFGKCFDEIGKLETSFSVAVTKLRLLYEAFNRRINIQLQAWVGNPAEVRDFFDYTEKNNKLPVL